MLQNGHTLARLVRLTEQEFTPLIDRVLLKLTA